MGTPLRCEHRLAASSDRLAPDRPPRDAAPGRRCVPGTVSDPVLIVADMLRPHQTHHQKHRRRRSGWRPPSPSPAIPIVPWASGVGPLTANAAFWNSVCDVKAIWACPVCGHGVHRRHRPGRPRVYCTNACRQRAYRWRRAHRDALHVSPPAQRAMTRDSTHALRSDRDFVALCRDSVGRRITACGVFARAANDEAHRFAHTNFHATVGTCRSCRMVLGLPTRELTDVVQQILEEDHAARTAERALSAVSPGVS